jgi:hypothetical protein
MALNIILAGLLVVASNPGARPSVAAPLPSLRAGVFELSLQDAAKDLLALRIDGWPDFLLSGLRPGVRLDGAEASFGRCRLDRRKESWRVTYPLAGRAALTLVFGPAEDGGLRLQGSIRNTSGRNIELNAVDLLSTQGAGGRAAFGGDATAVRVLEQGNYWGRVVPLVAKATSAEENGKCGGEPEGAAEPARHGSDFVSVVYDRGAQNAFLAGFESSERWAGRVEIDAPETGTTNWRIGFDGGDLNIDPGEKVDFEPVVFLAGKDPWRLLELYADDAARLHPMPEPPAPPVSWCSWYPYRLGVTEERVLDTARIARERLKSLGLRVIQIDLGWQTRQLPSTFDENDQFPHGLKWLSGELGKLGFDLGVWCAPFSISEFDPVAARHPEWLVKDRSGAPFAQGEWFWQPHGKVFILDLTHPGAQEHLRAEMNSLRERGVRYVKSDFIGCVADGRARNRYDPRIVGGGGLEAGRIGARIIRDSLPDALLLNCGGPEMPGTGHWPLLYACSDTGNTGFIPTTFQEMNTQALACHLFKNGRWGILQPSCLCVGLPGTVEDARLRATAAFLAGGQVDISDTLVSLPEDRWEILTSSLPPLGLTARPVDLFEPVTGPLEYGSASSTAQGSMNLSGTKEYPPGSVWHLRVSADWDEWDLVGVFNYENAASEKTPKISRFRIPFSLLDLPDNAPLWAYEFWSRQFLGSVPAKRPNPGGYEHPGDVQDLAVGDAPGVLDIAFFGPAAKLICLRRPRPHPWVVGTSFHQSCGSELKKVSWDDASGTLSGEVDRPRGATGMIFIAAGGRPLASCAVDGQRAIVRRTASGALCLPIIVRDTPARWKIRFAEPR